MRSELKRCGIQYRIARKGIECNERIRHDQ